MPLALANGCEKQSENRPRENDNHGKAYFRTELEKCKKEQEISLPEAGGE